MSNPAPKAIIILWGLDLYVAEFGSKDYKDDEIMWDNERILQREIRDIFRNKHWRLTK